MMDYKNNTSLDFSRNLTVDSTETLDELNKRFATALLPVTIVLGMLGFVGIVGNILVFIVYGFGKKFKDEKFRCFVLVLAIIDFTTCLTLIPAEMWKHQSYFNFIENDVCKVKCFFNVFAASSASYCLFIVAIDRYILTCHPFMFIKIRSFSHTMAVRLCVLMVFIGILTAIPSAIMCGTSKETMSNINGNITYVYLCRSDPLYETDLSRYIYRIVLCGTQALISLTMIFLYIQIGLAIKKVMSVRKANTIGMTDTTGYIPGHYNNYSTNTADCTGCNPHNQHQHIPTNVKLLFLITIVFILTYMLYIALSWVDQTKLTPTQFTFFSVFFRLYFIHSIINPILYAKMDHHFRRRCIKIFVGKRRYY